MTDRQRRGMTIARLMEYDCGMWYGDSPANGVTGVPNNFIKWCLAFLPISERVNVLGGGVLESNGNDECYAFCMTGRWEDDGTVNLTKAYVNRSVVDVVVEFSGTLSEDGLRMSGTWSNKTYKSQGNFFCSRQVSPKENQYMEEVRTLMDAAELNKEAIQAGIGRIIGSNKSLSQMTDTELDALHERVGYCLNMVNEEQMIRKMKKTKLSPECSVCLDTSACMAMIPCGHMCLCEYHGLHFDVKKEMCPVCRADVRSVQKIFI